MEEDQRERKLDNITACTETLSTRNLQQQIFQKIISYNKGLPESSGQVISDVALGKHPLCSQTSGKIPNSCMKKKGTLFHICVRKGQWAE